MSRAMTRTAVAVALTVAVALIGIAATGATVPVNATPGFAGVFGTPAPLDDPPTGPDDPACLAEPGLATCQGGPFGLPTSPSSVGCAIDPSDAICQGGPYAPPPPPPPPPPMDPFGGMPGAPIGGGMPGGIGMPGHM